jgi:hypothetical protein
MHAFDAPYRTVRVQADDETLSFVGSGMEQPYMTGMKNIETSIGKNNAFSIGPPCIDR